MPERRKMEPDVDEIEPPPKCDECGSDDVLPILYGLPTFEAWEEYVKCENEHRKPPFILGGCCIPEHPPRRQCFVCGHVFRFHE